VKTEEKTDRMLVSLYSVKQNATISDRSDTYVAFATTLPDGRVLWERGNVTQDEMHTALSPYLVPTVEDR